MFETAKDEAAALKAIEGLWQVIDKKAKPRLVRIFLENFLLTYKEEKKKSYEIFPSNFSFPYDKKHQSLILGANILEKFKHAIELINYCGPKIEPSRQAQALGRALGEVLSAIEYGIARHGFFWKNSEFENDILGLARQMQKSLKDANRSVKVGFVGRQLIRIANRRKDLTQQQRGLIADIALIFRG